MDFLLVGSERTTIRLRNRVVVLEQGDLSVAPRGVEHCPEADPEAEILPTEPRGGPNTVDADATPAVEVEI